jgi:hypothetical protein
MDAGALIVGVFTLIYGIAFCFVGYKYFRFLLPLWGFIAGFWISEAFVAALFGDSNSAVIAGWIVGLVAGLTLAALSYFIYQAALAILGATFGLWLVAAILGWLGLESSVLVTILALLGAILFAVLTFQKAIQKYLIIIFSALIGATGIVVGLLFLLVPSSVDHFRSGLSPLLPSILQESSVAALLWIFLALLGVGIQLLITRDKEEIVEPESVELESESTEEESDDFNADFAS